MSFMDPTGSDVRSLARGGAFTFAGSIVSAVMGLLFIVVIGRALGPSGAGIVLQGIAVFSIAMSIARVGLDTTAVWLLPRLVDKDQHKVRAALVGILLPALLLGMAAGAVLILGARAWIREDALAQTVSAMGWLIPAATLATVGLAATRALGGVRTYVTVGSIAIPASRPVLAWVVTVSGGTALGVAVSWAAPFALASVVVVLILLRQVRRRFAAPRSWRGWCPDRELSRRTWSFALPRAVSTGLEQAMTWLDVLVVGMLAGPAAAGIYGAATRFVSAGMLLSTSLRIVVAPIYSRHLGAGRSAQVQDLYVMSTKWIVAFSTPLYLMLALFGGSVLRLLGGDFGEGSAALAILAIGMGVVLVAGNVQSILLMSGLSALAAMNKGIAVTTNVALLLILVPRTGIVGAAIAWVVAMAVDTFLAVWQVRNRVGVRPATPGIWLVLSIATLVVGIPAVILRLTLGDTMAALIASVVLGVLALGVVAWRMRVLFQLDGLATVIRARSER